MTRRRGHDGMPVFTVGLIALVVISIGTYLGFTKSIPFRSHYEISAAFKSANNVKPNSPVRIAGVNVGKVTKVENVGVGSEGAIVTMRIEDKGRPIKEDATFKIRPRIFLEGNFFVDVNPGTPQAAEVEDGETVAITQTDAPVQLDQVLTALQTDAREDLKTLLKEYGDALDEGGAEAFNRSIPHWEPAYRDSAIVAEASLGILEHDLSEYVEHAGKVAQALDRSPEALKSLITDFNTTAGALAREDANLRAAVAELPRTLGAARPALAALNASFPSVRALAADLRPGVRNSEEAIDASTPLVRELRRLMRRSELRGLVSDLGPTVPALASLSAGSVDLYKQVRLTASCQNEVLLPWSLDKIEDPNFPAEGRVFEEAPKPFVGLAGESRSGDANGQWFRILTAGGTNLITLRPGSFAVNALPVNGTNPPKPLTHPPLRGDLDCETQQPPDLRTVPGVPPPQRKIDTSDPEFVKSEAKYREAFKDWLSEQLKVEGLADEFKVSDERVTRENLDRIVQAAKRGGGG